MLKVSRIEIPFPVVRLMLPADGEIVRHVLKKDKWPNNKQPFFRHEAVELAFGRKIRARRKDRKNERWWRPGIQEKGSYVALRGGWRLHKSVPIHADYFDGTFTARLHMGVQKGKFLAHVNHLDFEWNKSVFGDIANVLTLGALLPTIERSLERQIQDLVNGYLRGDFRRELNKLLSKDRRLRELRKRSSLSIRGTTVVVAVRTA